jgi:hypothetical protein
MSAPIDFEVEVLMNGTVITPVAISLPVQYDSPSPFTTDKISEIVVVDASSNLSRMRSLFGEGSINEDSSSSKSARYDDPTDLFMIDRTVSSGSSKSVTKSAYYPRDEDHPPVWVKPESSVYYPTLDFFPRFNQWFASTSWEFPYRPETSSIPAFYRVLLVYIDRSTKKVYYKNGRAYLKVATFGEDSIAGSRPVITSQRDPTLEVSFGDYVRPFYYVVTATGSPVITVTNLPAGLEFSGNAIRGTVFTPDPGVPFFVPSPVINATNPVGSVQMSLSLKLVDATLNPPVIATTNEVRLWSTIATQNVSTYQIVANAAPGSSIVNYSVTTNLGSVSMVDQATGIVTLVKTGGGRGDGVILGADNTTIISILGTMTITVTDSKGRSSLAQQRISTGPL